MLGCSGPPSGFPADASAFAGGAALPPDCSYTVTTKVGAEAPALADGVAIGADPAPRLVHLGLAGDPARSIVVGWRSGDADTEAVELRYGAGAPEIAVRPLTWQYQDSDGDVLRMYEAHLCGLEPDTAYSYRIRSGALESATFSFRTAPDLALQPDAEVVVLALGDARGKPEVFGELAAEADRIATPDLMMFTGDAVQRGSDQELWDAFVDAGAPLLTRIPSLFAVGNHEEADQLFFTTWALPGDERWFGLDLGAAHLTVLDDSTYIWPDEQGRGERFLAADLAAVPPERWKIVMHHKPIYSTSPGGHGPTNRLDELWLPLIDQHAVDLVLAGHDHNYQRSQPLRGGQPDPDGTTFVVTGGAGAPPYEVDTDWWTARAFLGYHFMILRIRRQSITATTYDDAGSVIDSFLLSR